MRVQDGAGWSTRGGVAWDATLQKFGKIPWPQHDCVNARCFTYLTEKMSQLNENMLMLAEQEKAKTKMQQSSSK